MRAEHMAEILRVLPDDVLDAALDVADLPPLARPGHAVPGSFAHLLTDEITEAEPDPHRA